MSLYKCIEYICYDDRCHLKKYTINPSRCDLTETTKILSNVTIAVDKMHMAGHIDPWCKKECDPHIYPDLQKVTFMLNYIPPNLRKIVYYIG